jgi:RNA polymerase sigma factor (TIGR02999 family)
MSDVSRVLLAIKQGDRVAAAQLLPLVYDELRKLAAAKLAQEKPGQTLQATALVHEAYLRLVDTENAQHWNGRGHFFGAAAEAMRRILVERARRKQSRKHGGDQQRVPLDLIEPPVDDRAEQLLAVHEALDRLEAHDPQAAQLVKLRYFAGLSQQEASAALGIGRRAAERLWTVARVRLFREIGESYGTGRRRFS